MANKNSNKLQNFLLKNENYVSLGLGILAVLIVAVLIVNYFQRSGQPTPEITEAQRAELSATPSAEPQAGDLPAKHTVIAGENLWTIAEKYYKSGYNWVDIAKENKLANPDVIANGVVLAIPKAEPKTVETTQVAGTSFSAENKIAGNNYTVQKGDTLWNIAEKAYGNGQDWVKIDQANKLGRLPNGTSLIHAGNVLTLPR